MEYGLDTQIGMAVFAAGSSALSIELFPGFWEKKSIIQFFPEQFNSFPDFSGKNNSFPDFSRLGLPVDSYEAVVCVSLKSEKNNPYLAIIFAFSVSGTTPNSMHTARVVYDYYAMQYAADNGQKPANNNTYEY